MKPARATLALCIALCVPTAFAHSVLQQSVPAKGATLDSVPPQMRLQFNEPLEAAFTRVRLVGPGGDVATGKATLDATDPSRVLMPLPPLPAGHYKAQWTAVGRDGHRVKGEFAFTVK